MINQHFGATDTGRVRKNNEDTFFIQPVLGGEYLAACVIDGVGGYEGGEVAAAIASDVLQQYLSIPSGGVEVMMQEAMIAANDQIVQAKQANQRLADMACVATLVLVHEKTNQFFYIHIGDTRLYLFRDDALVKVTLDQSFVGFLEDNGRLTEAEAMQHLKRNEIDKALGFDTQLRGQKNYFNSGQSPFLPGDLLLLCSDGLTDLVPAGAIKEILQSGNSLQQKTTQLITAANAAGGKDNITVVLVQHSQKPSKSRGIKPKTKTAKAAPKKTAVAKPPVKQAIKKVQQEPIAEKSKTKSSFWIWGIPLLVVMAAFLAWQFWLNGSGKEAGTNENAGFARLQKNIAIATDSAVWNEPDIPVPLVTKDTLKILQDSFLLKGNGLHLKSDTAYKGAAFEVRANNAYCLLQDLVLENFQTGIWSQSKKVHLKNVQFLNCAVPVQAGSAVPVNTPLNVLIRDSIFINQDTLGQ